MLDAFAYCSKHLPIPKRHGEVRENPDGMSETGCSPTKQKPYIITKCNVHMVKNC